MIRAVCLILDAFHFPLPADGKVAVGGAALAVAMAADKVAARVEKAKAAEAAAAAEAAEAVEGEEAAMEEDEDEEPEPEAAAKTPAAAAEVPAGEVYRMLSQRVVPELQRIMVAKDTVRAPVALAGACRQERVLGRWAGVAGGAKVLGRVP